jgi:hypothetical protein
VTLLGTAERSDPETRLSALARSERAWLAAALGVAVAVYASYLLTHPYPAYSAGLYVQIADEIAANGYRLPARIPRYTADGVPFAYPPLMFYVVAVLRDVFGADAVTLSRVLPGVFTVAYLVPYYYAARELLDSVPEAGLATVVIAVTPPVLQWHISAGGIVRSAAFLFALTGVYTGVRLFRSGDRRWVGPAAVAFGLTVLTHPIYAVFFGVTFLLLFLAFDRTPVGLLAGAAVALGGLLLASPWLWQVLSTHGVSVFADAAGTHGGIGPGTAPGSPQSSVIDSPPGLDLHVEDAFFAAAYVGTAYAVVKRRFFLPAWLVTADVVVGKHRFVFVAGAMLVAVLAVEGVAPRLGRLRPGGDAATTALRTAAVALLALCLVSTGVLFAVGGLDRVGQSPTQPAYMDADDREAMNWVRAETPPSADFVVLGDAAEWFPLFTDRTILVGPWGVEWVRPAEFRRQLVLYESVSVCGDAQCVTRSLREAGVEPDYVYVPKGEYTVRGVVQEQAAGMHPSLAASERYELVYENRGAAIYRVDDAAT